MIAPSRKIIAMSIVCGALLISVVYVKLDKADGAISNGLLTTVQLPEVNVPVYATEDMSDTDNDGLKDWQEVVQGTDANDADSDNDGTQDGAEVQEGRNPLKAGPDDKGQVAAQVTFDASTIYSAHVPRSLTDTLSKDLFGAYIHAKNQGAIDANGDTLADIASAIAQDALSRNEMVQKYSTVSIGTFPDSDKEAGIAYGEAFGDRYINMLTAIKQSNNDLERIADEYQAFSRDITALYVPASLASTQAKIGNSYYNLALMLSIIAVYEQDPIRAALAIKNMKSIITEQSQLFTSVGNYFRRNGILFENQDIQRLWENI